MSGEAPPDLGRSENAGFVDVLLTETGAIRSLLIADDNPFLIKRSRVSNRLDRSGFINASEL
jgi:hypothetical protein